MESICDTEINEIPPIRPPKAIIVLPPWRLSTIKPKKGITGKDIRRNKLIAENSVLDTPSSSLIGIRKKESPYPPMPAVVILEIKVIKTIIQP